MYVCVFVCMYDVKKNNEGQAEFVQVMCVCVYDACMCVCLYVCMMRRRTMRARQSLCR
jgi:hypothetical protein